MDRKLNSTGYTELNKARRERDEAVNMLRYLYSFTHVTDELDEKTELAIQDIIYRSEK